MGSFSDWVSRTGYDSDQTASNNVGGRERNGNELSVVKEKEILGKSRN